MERWTYTHWIEAVRLHDLPRLGTWFAAVRAGQRPFDVPTRLSTNKLLVLQSTLAARGVHIHDLIDDLRRDHIYEYGLLDDDPAWERGFNQWTTQQRTWYYKGLWGGHPALPSLTHAVCLAFLDEAAPQESWCVRRIIEQSELKAIFHKADGQDEILEYALTDYEYLGMPEVLVAERCARFLEPLDDHDVGWAVGVAAGEVLLGLTALITGTGAGTQILRAWQQSRHHLLAHNVTAPEYFAKHGFHLVPLPKHGAGKPYRVMAWNLDAHAAQARVQALGLPWRGTRVQDEQDGEKTTYTSGLCLWCSSSRLPRTCATWPKLSNSSRNSAPRWKLFRLQLLHTHSRYASS